MKVPVQVYVEPYQAAALRAKVRHLKVRWGARFEARRREAVSLGSTRRQALAEVTALRNRLRRDGELVDTATALVSVELRAELEDRGWIKKWRTVEEGLASIPGRRLGSNNNPNAPGGRNWREGDEQKLQPNPAWRARLAFSLDPALGELFHRAVYRATAQETAAYERGEYGGPITTTGDVLRAAVYRATADWFPRDDLVGALRVGPVADGRTVRELVVEHLGPDAEVDYDVDRVADGYREAVNRALSAAGVHVDNHSVVWSEPRLDPGRARGLVADALDHVAVAPLAVQHARRPGPTA
ncbi:MAG: hypothetical protein HOV94_40315 [Saccharothrix sp.]|nr:hypothetical protein [Saccharothrix sp.]